MGQGGERGQGERIGEVGQSRALLSMLVMHKAARTHVCIGHAAKKGETLLMGANQLS